MKVSYRRTLRIAILTTFGVVCSFHVAATPVDDAQALLQQGNPTAALAQLDRYLDSSPQDAEARFTRGLVLVRLNRTSDAIKAFADLTRDYPQLPEPYNNLAVLYAQQGNYEKSRDALEAALATHPSYATAHENLGDVYAALAGAAYNKALSLDQANSAIRYKLSLLSQLSKPDEMPTAVASARAPTVVATKPAAAATSAVAMAENEGVSAPVPSLAAQSSPTVAAAQPPITTAPSSAATAPVAASTVAAAEAPQSIPPTPDHGAVQGSGQGSSAQIATPEPVASGGFDAAPVLAQIDIWAAAWANHDVEKYLTFYASNFVPEGGLTRQAWELQRRLRVGKAATIVVELSDKHVDVIDANHLRVSFLQHYQSGNLNDQVHKVLELVNSGGQWKIGREFVTSR
jgi:Tfp pilus assembly protein PilF